MEAYIERESEAGDREDYDRVRGLVPHMRKRWWKASDKAQVLLPGPGITFPGLEPRRAILKPSRSS